MSIPDHVTVAWFLATPASKVLEDALALTPEQRLDLAEEGLLEVSAPGCPGRPARIAWSGMAATLRIYGENGFTFQFFDNLVRRERIQSGLLRGLLGNLKCFAGGRKQFEVHKLSMDADAEVWLFPNFGKRDGFGEPDAILILGDHAFWFEVETRVDLASTSARHQLRQMFRFHCAARAFMSHTEPDNVCRGLTVSDSDEPKQARLRLEGYQAARLVRRLRDVTYHHFVLFCVERPRGRASWRDDLAEIADAYFREWNGLVDFSDERTAFPLDRAWYVYWKHDLDRERFGWPDDLTDGYVPIK